MANRTPITNDEMLLQIVGNDMKKVIDDVAKWLLMQIEQSLIANVYNSPEGEYERLEWNGGLLGAWTKEATHVVGNYISAKVGFDDTKLEYNPSLHQHGSLTEDRTKIMPYLVESGTGWDFGGNAMLERRFWDVIESSLIDGSLDETVEASFRKNGIVFLKIR